MKLKISNCCPTKGGKNASVCKNSVIFGRRYAGKTKLAKQLITILNKNLEYIQTDENNEALRILLKDRSESA